MIAGSPAAISAFTVASLLVCAAAAAVPGTLRNVSRATRIVVATLTANVLVVAPIYVLGLADHLYPSRLATTVSFAALLVLATMRSRLGPGGARAEMHRTLLAFVRLPYDALRVAWTARSLAVLAVVVATVLVAWTTAQAVLAPTWGDWDCLWYHEPIIGFTIQNHGFRVVPLPFAVQKVNGYPRLTEMTMLWFGMFHGRWAIDLVNPLVVPMLAAGTYTLAFDRARHRATAIGFAAATITLPGVIRLLPTTMVDVHALALVVVAIAYATRPTLARSDVWVSLVATTLALGTKAIMLAPCGLVVLVLGARLFTNRSRFGGPAAAAMLAAGVAMLLAILGATYGRNYVSFHNPVWPDIAVDVPSLGIHWPGQSAGFTDSLPGAAPIPHGFRDQMRRLYGVPFGSHDRDAWQIADYGLGVPWALIPAALASLAILLFETMRALSGRGRTREDEITRVTRASAWRLAFILGPCLLAIPAFHIGRYHLASVVVAMGVVAGLATRPRGIRVAEAVFALVVAGNVATLALNDRGWLHPPERLLAMARTPAPLRFHAAAHRAPENTRTAMIRERELGPGEIVGFERIAYLALLWNDHYSNRVVWLRDEAGALRRAHAAHATWIYSSNGHYLQSLVAQRPEWEMLGPLEAEEFGNLQRLVPSNREAEK